MFGVADPARGHGRDCALELPICQSSNRKAQTGGLGEVNRTAPRRSIVASRWSNAPHEPRWFSVDFGGRSDDAERLSPAWCRLDVDRRTGRICPGKSFTGVYVTSSEGAGSAEGVEHRPGFIDRSGCPCRLWPSTFCRVSTDAFRLGETAPSRRCRLKKSVNISRPASAAAPLIDPDGFT